MNFKKNLPFVFAICIFLAACSNSNAPKNGVQNAEQNGASLSKGATIADSFVGKTDEDVDASTAHYYACMGTMLSNQEDLAIETFAENVESCLSGKAKITVSKVFGHRPNGSAIHQYYDEMNVVCRKKTMYNLLSLVLENGKEEECVVKYEDNGKPRITKIYEIWRVDTKTMKFVSFAVPKNMTCENRLYSEEVD